MQTVRLDQGMTVIDRATGYYTTTFPATYKGVAYEKVPAVFDHPKDFTKGVTEVLVSE